MGVAVARAARRHQHTSRVADREFAHEAAPGSVVVVNRITYALTGRLAPAPALVESDVMDCVVIVTRQTRVVTDGPVGTWKKETAHLTRFHKVAITNETPYGKWSKKPLAYREANDYSLMRNCLISILNCSFVRLFVSSNSCTFSKCEKYLCKYCHTN